MSDSLTPDEDFQALAAEYVLGLLDAPARARAAALLIRDAAFAAAVRDWEGRLLPLADTLAPAAPSARVWAGIAAGIAAATARPALWQSLKFWRFAGLGGGFAAAALAVALVLVTLPRPAPAVAALATAQGGVFLAQAAGGNLTIAPSNISVPAGRAAELWMILPGAAPKPLGLLAADHSVTVAMPNVPVAAVELAVSLEPPGGSPTGLPTGPVIAAAKFLPTL
jgi:anti-sigma-K factor RskA